MPNRFDPFEPQRGETTSFARSTLYRPQRLSRPYRALADFKDDENPGLRCASTWALSVSPLQGFRLAILSFGRLYLPVPEPRQGWHSACHPRKRVGCEVPFRD
jgi:hypothetical protein